ncbi:MAG TPA: MBOAT family O-acyltransferase [Anaerolineales bacterium]|nr:MBOAT family O-acyltransferase [Anaerolineales bacterium]
MGLLQIAASFAAAIVVGVLARGAWRTYLLLALSVLAVYWFQPAIPIRAFDFWLPSLTLVLVVITWLITSAADAWRARMNWIALLIMVGVASFVDLSRYIFPNPILSTSTPRLTLYLVFLVAITIAVVAITWLSHRQTWILAAIIILLILILVILKTPVVSLQTSIFFRALTHRPVENALANDLRWLGFSYIAFRLIHVLRDKQMKRLPELSLAEFGTYVVFFPSLAAGPIDRAERFAQDLRKDFRLTQDETLFAGQRLVIGLFKKFVLADTLAYIALNDALATQVRTTGWMWIIVYAYAFQIYFDFSGYTDIAIGIARLVGVRLPENFAAPYLKPNLTQFWNSWHMTLTGWIRSYFFNPFNRWVRQYKSIPAWTMILIGQLATMLMIGLWHGVTLNFVLWALWHGFGLFFQNRWSDLVKTRFPSINPSQQRALQVGGIILTFHFVALGWVFFALSSPSISWSVFLALTSYPWGSGASR